MLENKKEFKLISKKNPRSLLPNTLTIFGVCLGLSSIKFALDTNYAMAIIAIGFAAILDTLDGRVARLIKGSSKVGKELDSLTDVVSFGVAPCVIMYFLIEIIFFDIKSNSNNMFDKKLDRKFCVAPMMGYTTPYARNLYRILSRKTFLFTEMIASKTIIHSKNNNFIVKNDKQNPIALQVGGSEPEELAKCAKNASLSNYDEINLNVGCPSKAVQKGSFGACLMKNKTLVRQCLESMQINNNIEISLKCRIGLGLSLIHI